MGNGQQEKQVVSENNVRKNVAVVYLTHIMDDASPVRT